MNRLLDAKPLPEYSTMADSTHKFAPLKNLKLESFINEIAWIRSRLSSIAALNKFKLISKTLMISLLFTTSTGCVGILTKLPEPANASIAPQETKLEWCGIKLWVVAAPIPLMLPVCKMRPHQGYKKSLYACGPFMFLGRIMPDYRGFMFCGVMPG